MCSRLVVRILEIQVLLAKGQMAFPRSCGFLPALLYRRPNISEIFLKGLYDPLQKQINGCVFATLRSLFAPGEAYTHYKWSTGRGEEAPIWTSRVNCTGRERTLAECLKIPYGRVKECVGHHFAGVFCYDDTGKNLV